MGAKTLLCLFLVYFAYFNSFPALASSENGKNFVFIRYSRAVRSVYAQHNFGKLFLPLWFLDDPNNNYTEGSFGLGYTVVSTPNLKVDMAANALFSGIGSREYTTYFQPALTPSFSIGKTSGSAVLLFDIPMRHEDAFNFILDTLDVNYSIHPKVSVGASLFVFYNRFFQSWRAGPKVTIDLSSFLKGGFIEGVLWEGSNNQDEFQVRFGLNF